MHAVVEDSKKLDVDVRRYDDLNILNLHSLQLRDCKSAQTSQSPFVLVVLIRLKA